MIRNEVSHAFEAESLNVLCLGTIEQTDFLSHSVVMEIISFVEKRQSRPTYSIKLQKSGVSSVG